MYVFNKIIKLKHWQLFLIVVIPGLWIYPDSIQWLTNLISVSAYLLWIIAIIKKGQDELQKQGYKKLHLTSLKVFGIGAIIFVCLGLVLKPANSDWLFILAFSSVTFVIFHSFYLAGKVLSMLNEKEPTGFYIFENFLLISFFPIGVWFLQPRINRLLN